jgi:uncharacterized membrane protein YphA (DoxX/SURF4 family)
MTLSRRIPKTRYPIGILVIVILTALRCVTLVASLLDVQGSPLADWVRDGSPLPQPAPGSDFEVIARILIVGLLVASVLVVIGLLAHKQWAWVLAIVSSGLILAIDLGWWWSGEPRYGSMLLNSVAVFYLNQRDVRTALRGMVPTS